MIGRALAGLAMAATLLLGACAQSAPAPPPAADDADADADATRPAADAAGLPPRLDVAPTPPDAPIPASPAPDATRVAVPATPEATAPLAPERPPALAQEVSRAHSGRRELALTFDCGGHAGPTREILATLREAGVSVTFFMIGDWVRAYPDLAREIAGDHEFAHHSNTHPDYPSLTDEAIIADLEAGERAFVEVTGRTTRPFWRAPSGARDARVLAAAARAGWPLHVFWTQDRNAEGELVSGDSGDWRPFTPEQVAQNLERAAALGSGVITVSHCDSEQTRVVLGPAIRAIQARGLRIVTVSDLLR